MQSDGQDGRGPLFAHPWLANEPASFRSAIFGAAFERTVAAGQRLYEIGDEPGGIYGVVSGGILLSVETRSGDLVPAHLVRRGTWFGHGPLMTRRRRVLDARAVEDSVLLHLPVAALNRIIYRDPGLSRPIGAISDYTQDVSIACVADLLIRDTERRVAAVLLRVTGADRGLEPENGGGVPLTQSLLAELACTSRHSINRVLADFEARGFVTWRYGQVRIEDAKGLEGFARDAGSS